MLERERKRKKVVIAFQAKYTTYQVHLSLIAGGNVHHKARELNRMTLEKRTDKQSLPSQMLHRGRKSSTGPNVRLQIVIYSGNVWNGHLSLDFEFTSYTVTFT